MMGCQKYHSFPYYPQDNSGIERSHRTLNNVERATLLVDHCLTWVNVLPTVQLTLNSATHSAHAQPPSQLLLDTNMSLPVDCHLLCIVPKPPLSEKDYVPRLKATLAAC